MVMTLEADYAVRIVEYLTKHPERRDAKTISVETQIPLRFSLKILRELVAEGLVCSFKGDKGGYTLAKSPEEITLRQVIELVEGPYIHHCVGIHEDVVPVLYEACKYLGIQPDLYDDNEEQVKAYLRGE